MSPFLAIAHGEELQEYIKDLASLRIAVFQEYPYLYDGTPEHETIYLKQYTSSKSSLLVVAKDGEQIIGAITGIPLNQTFPECRDFFVKENISMNGIFYLGEILLLKKYRRQGIGSRMYEAFEELVRENKTYQKIIICETIPLKDDPRRTSDYFCLDSFWTKRNFVKRPELVTQFSWKEIGTKRESCHPMVFWIKEFC